MSLLAAFLLPIVCACAAGEDVEQRWLPGQSVYVIVVPALITSSGDAKQRKGTRRLREGSSHAALDPARASARAYGSAPTFRPSR